MHFCYIDESGTPEIPGNTSHFVLAGVSMPIWHWRDADREVGTILSKYGLGTQELHTAWLMRRYLEQSKVPSFASLDYTRRRSAIGKLRAKELLRLQKLPDSKPYKQAKKNFRHSEPYVHLTQVERTDLVREVADRVSKWGFARLFAEVIDKTHFDPTRSPRTVEEQAFEQIVTRFNRYLVNIQEAPDRKAYGLLVHDNNQSVARKHTAMMRSFQKAGTLWTDVVDNIIETPMFVDSQLTRMVQVADLCSYALRRYAENKETDIFRRVFERGDRFGEVVVGIRHFADRACSCEICVAHSPK